MRRNGNWLGRCPFVQIEAPAPCGGPALVALLLPADENSSADHGECDPSPQRHVDLLFLADRDLESTDLRFVGLLGVTEPAVREGENPGDQEHEAD